MAAYFWIAIGSALGGVARFAIGNLIGPRNFPIGTLLVNVSGAVLIGIASGLLAAEKLSPAAAQFWMVGILGGYTTFSAFSLQSLELLQQSRPAAAAGYIAASVLLCLGGVWLGQSIARR